MYKPIFSLFFIFVIVSVIMSSPDTSIKTAISSLVVKDINKTSHHAETDTYYYVGGDEHRIYLQNNPHALDVSYDELINFVKSDETDLIPYTDTFVCADFAERLHNNAEANGIRSAWVAVEFLGDVEGHALNAFSTTDKGLIYIDNTGLCTSMSCNYDKVIEMKIGEPSRYYEISECDGFYYPLFVNEEVKKIEIFW